MWAFEKNHCETNSFTAVDLFKNKATATIYTNKKNVSDLECPSFINYTEHFKSLIIRMVVKNMMN